MKSSMERQLRLHMDVLFRRIGESGRSFSGLEEELGWEAGKLTGLSRCPENLQYQDLFEVLEALGVSAREFFGEVAAESEE